MSKQGPGRLVSLRQAEVEYDTQDDTFVRGKRPNIYHFFVLALVLGWYTDIKERDFIRVIAAKSALSSHLYEFTDGGVRPSSKDWSNRPEVRIHSWDAWASQLVTSRPHTGHAGRGGRFCSQTFNREVLLRLLVSSARYRPVPSKDPTGKIEVFLQFANDSDAKTAHSSTTKQVTRTHWQPKPA